VAKYFNKGDLALAGTLGEARNRVSHGYIFDDDETQLFLGQAASFLRRSKFEEEAETIDRLSRFAVKKLPDGVPVISPQSATSETAHSEVWDRSASVLERWIPKPQLGSIFEAKVVQVGTNELVVVNREAGRRPSKNPERFSLPTQEVLLDRSYSRVDRLFSLDAIVTVMTLDERADNGLRVVSKIQSDNIRASSEAWFEIGDSCMGRVVDVVWTNQYRGLLVDIGCEAFLPAAPGRKWSMAELKEYVGDGPVRVTVGYIGRNCRRIPVTLSMKSWLSVDGVLRTPANGWFASHYPFQPVDLSRIQALRRASAVRVRRKS
jgi:hypothetical protein